MGLCGFQPTAWHHGSVSPISARFVKAYNYGGRWLWVVLGIFSCFFLIFLLLRYLLSKACKSEEVLQWFDFFGPNLFFFLNI